MTRRMLTSYILFVRMTLELMPSTAVSFGCIYLLSELKALDEYVKKNLAKEFVHYLTSAAAPIFFVPKGWHIMSLHCTYLNSSQDSLASSTFYFIQSYLRDYGLLSSLLSLIHKGPTVLSTCTPGTSGRHLFDGQFEYLGMLFEVLVYSEFICTCLFKWHINIQ